jgi:hypothetical protein
MNNASRQWHLTHKMPVKPSLEERIAWHVEHAWNCDCRAMPERILKEVQKRKIQLPANVQGK